MPCIHTSLDTHTVLRFLLLEHLKHCINFSFISADINECSEEQDNCSVNSNCTNTIGSYECTCHTGYLDEGLGYVCTGM